MTALDKAGHSTGPTFHSTSPGESPGVYKDHILKKLRKKE
jgi:hypothetical protein